MEPSTIELIGAALFAIAIAHTFCTDYFEHLAHTRPAHAGLWHLLGEVEVVFGLWALVLVVTIAIFTGPTAATTYIDSQNFTEPMFVFAIMVVAGSRPIIQLATQLVRLLARLMPLQKTVAFYLATLSFVPLMGSFITEPAAMTLAALILLEQYYSKNISTKLKYATLGVLFVNISIGGTLTPYAAPPVLMVASKWGWDTAFMMSTFGWKAALAVTFNAVAVTLLFYKELKSLGNKSGESQNTATETLPQLVLKDKTPILVTAVHIIFLIGIVVFAHHAAVFMGLLLFFLGFTEAYKRFQDPLILREGLMVAFFLAGLVTLGGQQQWWLKPLLMKLDEDALFFGAIALTAFTDNAALTYLGSLVEGLSDPLKYALVAGAVTGGGLTVIANAPNPAGFSILKSSFDEGSIHPLGLLAAALLPTLVAIIAFRFL